MKYLHVPVVVKAPGFSLHASWGRGGGGGGGGGQGVKLAIFALKILRKHISVYDPQVSISPW